MGDPNKGKKGSKAGSLLLVGLLAVVGVGVAGYLKPDLPVVGPLVSGFFKKGAAGVDQSGVYKVVIKTAAVSPAEFNEGETVDLQVSVKQFRDGKEISEWTSNQYGDRLATVGKDTITATWADRPFEVQWRTGDTFKVTIWDYKGGSKELCVWETAANAKELPLAGTHSFDLIMGKPPRPGGTNQVVLESSRTGDIPPANNP